MNRVLLSTVALLTLAPTLPAQSPPSYAKHVRPFLAKYCLECHNAKEAEAGLNLETIKAMRTGGDGGPVLTAGKPDESRIVLLVEGKDKPAMPPKKAKLHPKKEEIGVLRAWIAAGARDDSAEIKVVLPAIKPRKDTPAPVRALAYHPSRNLLLIAQQRVMAYDLDHAVAVVTQKGLQQTVTAITVGPTDIVITAASKPDQSAVAFSDPFLRSDTRSHIHHQDAILDVAVSPDGKLAATCGYDTQVKLTEIAQDRLLHTLKEHSDAVYGVAFSPDSKQLASCSADRAVKVFDVASGKLLYTLGEATDWLYTVAWSPDGKYLAAGGVDKSIRVYAPGPQTAKLVHSVFAHQEPVQKILFSKDSKTLYSLGQGGTLKSWDVARMVERKVYDRQPDTTLCMALRPDGKQIALGRYDGVVVLLDEATGKVQAEIRPGQPKPKQAVPPAKKQAAPQVKQITPSAVARGKTTTLKLVGSGLDQISAVETNTPGAKVMLQGRETASRSVEITVPGTVTPGSYQLQFKNTAGTTLTTSLIVDAHPAYPEKDAGGSPVTGQKITLPTTIAGSIDRAGDVDFFRFDAKKGRQLGVQIVTAAVGSKLEPALQLVDLSGHVLAESGRGYLGHTFAADGSYALGVRDRDLRGGANMHYRLHLGEIPVVTAFFPLGVQRGHECDVLLDGVFLNTAKVRLKAAADAAPGSKVAVALTATRGTPLGLPQLTVGESPEVQPELRHRIDVPTSLGTIPIPGTANGRLAQPGDADTWAFHAKKGKRLVVEVAARRLGSELDSFIDILDAKGQPVPRVVLRCQAKTIVTFRDHDSSGAGIRLDAWSELATNDFLYVGGELMRIQDLPPNPDADCTFFNANGPRLGFLDTTPTHHALGTPMYKVSVHPPGTTFPPNGFPVFTLFYRNDDGGPGYGRDSRLFFDPPADGQYQVRIRDTRGLGGPGFAYRLTVRPPRPSFSVRFDPTTPTIYKGSSTSVRISADRIDGYDGPVALHFENVPAGLSVPPTAIEAGTFSTTVALYAEPNTKLSAKTPPLKLVGEAMIDGKKQVREAAGGVPKLSEPGDLVTVTEESELTIQPGQQVKLNVRIERRNGFAGRVPVEVRGLPHGVHALDIGLNGILVNENETRRTVVIYAEPWVQSGVHPFVVLARREGKNTEHGAKAILLKVAGK